MNDLPKRRPKARNSVALMDEDAYTEDKVSIKTIYVGNLYSSSRITEKEVKEYFLKFGSVASVAIKRTRSKRAPWFYAFVTFQKRKSARKALRLAKHKIFSRRVVVRAANRCSQPKKTDAKCNRNNVSRNEASEMDFRLLHLNDDCLYHIASYLELGDFFNLSKTCKRLECGLEPAFASYKKLDIRSLRGLTLKQIREILYKIGPHVQHIVDSAKFELNRGRLNELLKKYCVAENIVSLEFFHTRCLSKSLIQTFKNLKTLTCPITDEMSTLLCNFKNLQNLNLYGITNFTGKHLDKLSNLQNLNLRWCLHLRPEFFENLCMKTKLVSLKIVGCTSLDYSSIETLARTQTKLETFSISYYCKTSNLSPLGTLKNLKRLFIDCFKENCDEFFLELAKHGGAELEVLQISRCSFNQKVDQAIFSLKNLKVLALVSCKSIRSEFLTKLALTSLECLAIESLEEDVLNLISKSETIKVLIVETDSYVDKQQLVFSAYEIIKKKERRYPFSLFTRGPCIIDGILHRKPIFGPRREYRKIMKKLGYLDSLPEWFALNNYFY